MPKIPIDTAPDPYEMFSFQKALTIHHRIVSVASHTIGASIYATSNCPTYPPLGNALNHFIWINAGDSISIEVSGRRWAKSSIRLKSLQIVLRYIHRDNPRRSKLNLTLSMCSWQSKLGVVVAANSQYRALFWKTSIAHRNHFRPAVPIVLFHSVCLWWRIIVWAWFWNEHNCSAASSAEH